MQYLEKAVWPVCLIFVAERPALTALHFVHDRWEHIEFNLFFSNKTYKEEVAPISYSLIRFLQKYS